MPGVEAAVEAEMVLTGDERAAKAIVQENTDKRLSVILVRLQEARVAAEQFRAA